MYLVNEKLVKRLMTITIARLMIEGIAKEEIDYLGKVVDIINQMEVKE